MFARTPWYAPTAPTSAARCRYRQPDETTARGTCWHGLAQAQQEDTNKQRTLNPRVRARVPGGAPVMTFGVRGNAEDVHGSRPSGACQHLLRLLRFTILY